MERYFDVVDEIWATRDSEPAQEFAAARLPGVPGGRARRWRLTDEWLAAPGHPAPLRRLVAEGRDGVVRAITARERDTRSA